MSNNSVTGDALISKPNSEEYRNNFDRIFGKKMDDADRADERIENAKDDGINEARRYVEKIPKGHSGECDYCGEYSKRIVNDSCAKCRDKYRLE